MLIQIPATEASHPEQVGYKFRGRQNSVSREGTGKSLHGNGNEPVFLPWCSSQEDREIIRNTTTKGEGFPITAWHDVLNPGPHACRH